ncbi:MAG: class I SAM-dependent methyltransferase, partial [Chloroflexi bacterium]|nr:class I SAM-dependent methyltransferase [Chloroflexota bacterium]
DVASGPIQYPTYLTYSENYDIRVCVDVSFQALIGAKQRVPAGRGLFVLGNIRNLPFRTGAFDAIVSLHTVYHIIAEQQHAVFDELHRVLKPAGRAVIVYTWGNISPLNQPAAVISKIGFAISQRMRRMFPALTFLPEPTPEDTFYYHPHRSGWFKRQRWDYPFAILCWRSVSVGSSKMFLHGWPGKQLLRLFFWWEDRFPRFTAFLGQYPMFLIDKR